jgi:chemosensory pili system protein ChpC
MRAPQRIEPKKIQEVASLLIPLQGQSILLPNVTVAEIIPVSQIQPVAHAPAWYLGNFQWRELTVPLLSLEALNGEPVPNIHNRARLAVLNTTGLHGDLAFIALLTQGLPRLARVSEDEISEREDAENRPYDLMHVSWAGEYTLIPDVTAIEQAFLNYLHSYDQSPVHEELQALESGPAAVDENDEPGDSAAESEGANALESAGGDEVEVGDPIIDEQDDRDLESYLAEESDSDEFANDQPDHGEAINQDESDEPQTRDHF